MASSRQRQTLPMTFDYVAGAALALLLTGYLLYALLWPERF